MEDLESMDDDQELLEPWLTVIGMITMLWSPAERSIDQCVHLIYTINDMSSSKKKPTRLGSKIDTIKRYTPSSIASLEDIESLEKITKSAVQIRDVFVHGVIESYDKEKMIVSKVNGRTPDHLLEKFTVDSERLNRSAQNLEFIKKKWGDIAGGLLELSQNS